MEEQIWSLPLDSYADQGLNVDTFQATPRVGIQATRDQR